MPGVLYIISTGPEDFDPTLFGAADRNGTARGILIQEGVRLSNVPLSRVLALADDVHARNLTTPHPLVSYREMLRLIFEADRVIVL